jgi:hypothetical protein
MSSLNASLTGRFARSVAGLISTHTDAGAAAMSEQAAHKEIRNREDLTEAKRIVIKAGTNVVSTPDGFPSLSRCVCVSIGTASCLCVARAVWLALPTAPFSLHTQVLPACRGVCVWREREQFSSRAPARLPPSPTHVRAGLAGRSGEARHLPVAVWLAPSMAALSAD